MSRKQALNITLSSNIDLTKYSNKRVTITRTEEGRFHFHSTLRFYRCERHPFVDRFIKRLFKRRANEYHRLCILGTISAPHGYMFD